MKKYISPNLRCLFLIFIMVSSVILTTGCGDDGDNTADNNNFDIEGSSFNPNMTATNSLGMTFNQIPSGTFDMGSPEDEPGRQENEKQHQVTLTQPFYLQTTEITQKQWEAIMGDNPSWFDDCGENCPVEMVSWNDVQIFIEELNKLGEGTYRLPTEAEWEYACRAGSDTAFSSGEITETGRGLDTNLDPFAWYAYNAEEKTHPVGLKSPNAWGLYDMHGNVMEWCSDWYGEYSSEPATDPKGPLAGMARVLRGGYWYWSAGDCRSAIRGQQGNPNYRLSYTGFRLVRTSDK